ncbi:MAG: hypothetical protein ACD_69C00021G0002 [uncultured bacterium]|nr:MAG: hypothetical protein ACD_69C00021G0002 [uncultured bacterium]OGT07814.1 MAG: hypothetical protein A2V89_00825 [Gammaproteobacteria bacterium RBG_16_37_9]HBC71930.1 hypothetical protein [Coxiellaceae bacterium]HBS51629.1 hypothetical protein [Coxiellaceae bacterium]HBY55283.1 hypothetical protein [Coxiellaceae bacterium]
MTSHLIQKKWPIIIVFVIGLIFGVIFFYFKKPAVVIPTVAVTKGSITEQSEAVGYIKTSHFSTVKSQVDGVVEKIYHNEGEYITKNTPLIKIKPTPDPARYAEIHNDLVSAIEQEKHAEVDLKRYEKLLKTGIITANFSEYIITQKNYSTAKNKKILSEQKLSLLDRGEAIVGDKTIASIVVSPIDGYILYRNVDIGDPVISMSSAQAATTLFKVANMQELMFQGSVDERDAAKIKIGMMAKVKIGSLPNQEITGKVSRIALQSDKENTDKGTADTSFNVGFRIEVTDLQFPKDLVLRSGYSATAEIKIKKVDDILMLPLRVIQFKDTKPYVLLPDKKAEKPKQQPVELGVSDDINVEIKTGLKLDDKVVDQPDMSMVNN